MNFADLFFLYAFLPIVLILYYICPNVHYRNAVLIVFSLVFYAWGNPAMVCLLIGFSLVNYILGCMISARKTNKFRKIFLSTGLVLNIGLLLSLKYLGFFIDTANSLFGFTLGVPEVLLPLGLSFFTFRVISYLLDVYWEKVEAERSFSSFLLFVSLFPCTVAGPIVRYSTIGESLHIRSVCLDDLYQGLIRICIGLGKKVILADSLYEIVEHYWGGSLNGLTVSEMWFALLVYSMYVYFDFSGYSDMAIGLGRLFGFRFEENFRYPFICTTISEFWQRWHISLGSFFRDYLLYVPIFGRMRRYGGLFLVWFCTGLWHGASWNYVLWGLYFGMFILIETLLGKRRIKKIPKWIRHLYTKFVIVIGFGIFYFTDLPRLGEFFIYLFGLSGHGFSNELSSIYMSNHIFLVVLALICTFPIGAFLRERMKHRMGTNVAAHVVTGVWALFLLILSSLLLVSSTNNPFLYAQF